MKFIGKPETDGDITGVDLTGSAPIVINSEAGTTSGNYSATISVDVATASARGIVELATTAETTTGTDANRAVTPDGLKDGYQGSTNVTTLGTITTGTWQGTAINQTYLVGQSGTNTGDETLESVNELSITSLGTIGTGVWNGTAIASAYLDADTMHYSAQRQLTHHTIKDDIGTGVIYISLGEIDAESGSKSNKNLPLLAPVAGKLLKVFLRTVEDMSASGHDTNLTWRLLTRAATATTTGNATVIGTQTGAGPTGSSMATYDFTSCSGTNAIVAGDKVQLSVQSDAASADSLFFITCLWEWDLS